MSAETQHIVRKNAEEFKDVLGDLSSWEESMKIEDEKLNQAAKVSRLESTLKNCIIFDVL